MSVAMERYSSQLYSNACTIMYAHAHNVYFYMYMYINDGTYRVILRIMKAGCHP